ncbi:Uncharacterized protein FWK35_00027507 [Aphis craccivora]|uniref:Uncharacterized protein n=1 Tax=Aphis craccivora TaxID=307492 RepID=A0A6G0Z040_APHCR|nr:Uncharacterized protein FWK35_00027507 [Aphis craccivora]
MHKRINGLFCPPLGLTDRFNVTVVGAEWTWVGGCAYMQRYPSISPSQLFHLWLRRDGGVGHCGDLHNMDHFKFECLSKNPPFIEEELNKGWQYVSLYEHTLFEYYSRSKQEQDTNRPAYRCALYSTFDNNPNVIWIAMSGNMYANQLTKCDGLSKLLENGPEEKQPLGSNGPMLLFLNKEELQFRPKKRSTLHSGDCRFPDWSQGLWSDFQVNGNVAYYANVIYDEDDVDFAQENDSESIPTDNQYDLQTNTSHATASQQENIQCGTRSSTHQNQQQRETTKFKWRCIMFVENDEKHQRLESGVKILTYGGRIAEKNYALNSNDKNNIQESDTLADFTEDSTMSYGCLWLEPKGSNIFYSIVRTGMPEKDQDLQSFAQQLCTEKKAIGRDGKWFLNSKNLT